MDKPPGISFAIMIASLAPVSLEWQQQVVSRFSKRRIRHHEPMPSVNDSWEVCDESALDHVLILHEQHLHRVLHAYVAYFNGARPHQGIHQQIPEGDVPSVPQSQSDNGTSTVIIPMVLQIQNIMVLQSVSAN
jgi:hypothetical protein